MMNKEDYFLDKVLEHLDIIEDYIKEIKELKQKGEL